MISGFTSTFARSSMSAELLVGGRPYRASRIEARSHRWGHVGLVLHTPCLKAMNGVGHEPIIHGCEGLLQDAGGGGVVLLDLIDR